MHVVPVSFAPGTEITTPPPLVETLDLLHQRGGGSLFWPFADPPCILLSLAGKQVFDDAKRLTGSTPFRVQIALCDTAAGPVVILDLRMYDTPSDGPMVMTCYLNPLESEEREALFKVLKAQQVHLVFFERRTVRRVMAVSTADQTGETARLINYAVQHLPKLYPPLALDWGAALERARRFWERGQG
jgi:hypothetical protein